MSKPTQQSLRRRQSELAMANNQLEKLSNGIFSNGELPTFAEKINQSDQFPLRPTKIEILQINVGYMCNQVCEHCHVDAGPDRKEIMTKETMNQCLEVIRNTKAHTLDLTGGAPEMNPNFRWFVEEARKAGAKEIIVRSNLTILRANKKYYDLPEFFKEHNIHVISSMPHWTRGKTDKQRGEGVFDQSI
ncbi:MAG TPA: 4Fe-4S cluster-binding domain-containing protein, partial [Aequorivita sp.]|nr:4Fe-4S cluster-binding domain-containing protein [Aequorivita sp.]